MPHSRFGHLLRIESHHSGNSSVFDPCFNSNKGKSFSDHLAVHFIINRDKPDCIQRRIRYRKYRGKNIKECIEDLQASQHLCDHEGIVDELVEVYNKASRVS